MYYRVPICCIAEPNNYSVNYQDQKLKTKAKPPEKQFHNLKVRSPKGDYVMECSNWTSILDFKQMYIEKLGAAAADVKVDKVRMFCLGKELKDDLFLYTYDVTDELTIQVMISK